MIFGFCSKTGRSRNVGDGLFTAKLAVYDRFQRCIDMRTEAFGGFPLRNVQLDDVALPVNLLNDILAGEAGAH
ncbi:hypothetical protein D3C87_1979710 [compost metagenome]